MGRCPTLRKRGRFFMLRHSGIGGRGKPGRQGPAFAQGCGAASACRHVREDGVATGRRACGIGGVRTHTADEFFRVCLAAGRYTPH